MCAADNPCQFCAFLFVPQEYDLPHKRTAGGISTTGVNQGMGDIAPGGQPMVRFVNVQKSYDGETLVVRDLNLDIAKGEFVTMLGPSGSGKTTTLMMLAGFEPATHGEIYLAGRPVNQVPPHKRGIGMVFQNYALFPHMTVSENLAFPLAGSKHEQGGDRRARENACSTWSSCRPSGIGVRTSCRAASSSASRWPGRSSSIPTSSSWTSR